MTKDKIAEMLGTTRQTLNRWEKEKPHLIRLINQGLALDETIEEAEKHLNRLKEIKSKSNQGKLNYK